MNDIGTRIGDWCTRVIDGSITSGRYIRMAGMRYLQDLETAGARGYYFDEVLAEKAILLWPERFRHTRGRFHGQPFHLAPSQEFIIWNLIGWRRKDNDFRRFRSAMICVARKWGKSMFASTLLLYCLYYDEPREPEAQAYTIATNKRQARLTFDQACKIILLDPELMVHTRKMFRDAGGYRELNLLDCAPWHGSIAKPLGSDQPHSGLDPHIIIVDELHEWREHHRELLDTLETGAGARRQPLTVYTTTAGNDDSILWHDRDEWASRVLESNLGENPIGDSYFAFLARLDTEQPCFCGSVADCQWCNGTGIQPADDVFDPDNWVKANPELGYNPPVSFLETQAEKARESVPAELSFRRYHCNIRVRSLLKVIDPQAWASCAGQLSEWNGNCYGAFDIGTRNDLASIALVRKNGDTWEVMQHSWCPSRADHKLDSEPWVDFVRGGHLTLTAGNTTDLAAVRNQIVEWTYKFGVCGWVADPHNARQLMTELNNDYGVKAEQFIQSPRWYNEPIREFLRLIGRCEIRHDGDKLLSWAAGNLVVRANARGEVMPDKDQSVKESGKIDPVVSVIMALGYAITTAYSSEYSESENADSN